MPLPESNMKSFAWYRRSLYQWEKNTRKTLTASGRSLYSDSASLVGGQPRYSYSPKMRRFHFVPLCSFAMNVCFQCVADSAFLRSLQGEVFPFDTAIRIALSWLWKLTMIFPFWYGPSKNFGLFPRACYVSLSVRHYKSGWRLPWYRSAALLPVYSAEAGFPR